MIDAPGEVLEDQVATKLRRWTLHHPHKRNAVTPAMLTWMTRRCRELAGEVIILRSGMAGTFCSGFDLGELARLRGGQRHAEATPATRAPALAETGSDALSDALPDATLIAATEAMECADATFVAAIAGVAVGAGVELAAACDVRVVATTAAFAVPAGRVGVVYHAAGIRRLERVFGGCFLRRVLLCGDTISASDPVLNGVFERVGSSSAIDDMAEILAAEILALDEDSVRGNRECLRALHSAGVDAEFLAEHERRRRRAYAHGDERRSGA